MNQIVFMPTKNLFSLSISIFSLLTLTVHRLEGRVHDYETARLKSTAGAGVASVLLDETVLLNPAPLAFFSESAIYGEKNTLTLKNEGEKNSPEVKEESISSDSYGVILADAKGSVKGAVSYQTQREWENWRKRFSAAFSSPIAEHSAAGIQVRQTEEGNFHSRKMEKKKYWQISVGAIHALSESFTVGVVIFDPLRSYAEDNRFAVGMQYMITKNFALMADVGSDYNDDLKKAVFYRGGAQINFFSDLYLRAGLFRDLGRKEEGSGVGLAWVGPRLVFNLGMKTTRFNYSLEELKFHSYPPNKMREVALSMSIRF